MICLSRKGCLRKISFLGRYDSMGDHSNGVANEEGQLYITDYSRQRLTGGVTLSFGKSFSGRFAYQLREIFFMMTYLWLKNRSKTNS
mgnify:CR=1 FL=1